MVEFVKFWDRTERDNFTPGDLCARLLLQL